MKRELRVLQEGIDVDIYGVKSRLFCSLIACNGDSPQVLFLFPKRRKERADSRQWRAESRENMKFSAAPCFA
jgi:hypothetical protein